MNVYAKQRLGERGEDPWADFLAGGFATQVELLPDEVPLQPWDAGLVGGNWFSSAWGVLYLTTQRLVWIRWRFATPWVQKIANFDLESISGAGVGRSLTLGLGLSQFVTVALKDGGEIRFWPSRYGARPEQIAGEIVKILRERGLLDG